VLAGAGALALSPLALSPAAAADKDSPAVVEYKGWKNNLRLDNGDVELIVTLDVGPRVISYRPAGGKNVFKEYEGQLGKSGEKDWQIRGGHRLWVGPEDLTRTYAPDNGPVKHKELDGGGVRFTPAADQEYGVQREFDVVLPKKGGRVKVVHRITNVGDKPTELAPWGLSVMAPGGVEIVPLPPKKPHPGSPKNAKSPQDFGPNQRLILWPYFDFKDPRWGFGEKYITLRQDNKRGPTKLGLAHQLGWVAYLNGGSLFVKRLPYQEGKPYPDGDCNFETFTAQDMLEIESLGPVVRLAPKESVEHTEEWELFKDVGDVSDEASIDKNVLPKVAGK
jgi:hypothetical protein